MLMAASFSPIVFLHRPAKHLQVSGETGKRERKGKKGAEKRQIDTLRK
jgi:hypothetical protein